MALPIALQLYTVRDALTGDLETTLAAIAKIGYQYVEVAGVYGKTHTEFRELLTKHGLTPVSMHCNLVDLTETLPQTIQNAKDLGVKYAVCSSMPTPRRADYAKAALELADAADKAAAQGITVAYHNHSFEFDKDTAGKRGMDTIFETTRGRKLQSELDIYWVQHGGDKPIDWMKKLANRVDLLHVKDMDRTPDRGFAEVGTGIVDIKLAVTAAPSVGVKYLIIEQDRGWRGSPLESAKISYDNLKAILSGK